MFIMISLLIEKRLSPSKKETSKKKRNRWSSNWLPIGNLQAKKQEAQSLTLHLTNLGIVHGVHILYLLLCYGLIVVFQKQFNDQRERNEERRELANWVYGRGK